MLKITKDFITPEEELQILANIKPISPRKTTARNRILRYGSDLPYKTPMLSKDLPEWIEFLVDRLMDQQFVPEKPDHITINEYHAGQNISYHIDSKSSGEIITVLCLKSDAVMGMKDEKGVETQHPVPARSLVQLTGDERWKSKHCIFPVPSTRYSIVFRKGTK
jgi:alkylated DNA repair dioxygenase AlkB